MSEIAPRLWTPGSHEEFGREIEQGSGEEYQPERIKQVIVEWGNLFGEMYSNELQAELSIFFLKTLEYYGGQDESSARENLIEIYLFYRDLFRSIEQSRRLPGSESDKSWNFDSFKKGFMAEYAVAKALTLGGHQVWYPTVRDDEVLKVDWWVYPREADDADALFWAVQVKNIGLRNKPTNEPVIIDARNQREINQAAMTFTSTLEQRFKFVKNNTMMATRLNPFENVRPMVLLVPSPSIDNVTGRPTEEFTAVLNQKIEEINQPKNYQ